GLNNEGSEPIFRLLRLSSDGIKEEKSVPISGSFDLKTEGDSVLFTSGLFVDGVSFQRLGLFSVPGGTPLPDVSNGRVYFLTGDGITTFNTTNFTSTASITLPEPPRSLLVPFIKWGADGLAWLYRNRIYLLRTSLRGDTDGDGLDDAWELA